MLNTSCTNLCIEDNRERAAISLAFKLSGIKLCPSRTEIQKSYLCMAQQGSKLDIVQQQAFSRQAIRCWETALLQVCRLSGCNIPQCSPLCLQINFIPRTTTVITDCVDLPYATRLCLLRLCVEPLLLSAVYTKVSSVSIAYTVLQLVKPWLHSPQDCQEEAQSQWLACKCTDTCKIGLMLDNAYSDSHVFLMRLCAQVCTTLSTNTII